MSKVMIIVLLSIAALTLAGCGAGAGTQQSESSQKSDSAATESTATGAAQAGSDSIGEKAPTFTATTLDGGKFELAEKRGEVVALYFMAGWCGTCIPEAQSWSKLYPEYKDKGLSLLVVSVDPNDTPQTIERFREAGSIDPLPWTIDKTGGIPQSLDVRSLDATVIIDRGGRIVYRDAAPTPYETLESELKEVL
jgi:peroxiredoxin